MVKVISFGGLCLFIVVTLIFIRRHSRRPQKQFGRGPVGNERANLLQRRKQRISLRFLWNCEEWRRRQESV